MSWEGWYQLLCEHGHYNMAHDTPIELGVGGFTCYVESCDGRLAWWNQVDETNGGSEGMVKLRLKKKAAFCKCPKCKNVHMKKAEEYCIPKTKGHRVEK